MPADTPSRSLNLWIVGPGRVGLALGLALYRSGIVETLTVSGRRAAPPDHPLFDGDPPPARYRAGFALPDPAPDTLVVSVPDRHVAEIAATLASAGPPEGATALHTSGVLDSEALAPLRARGCAVGSLHPLLAISEPVRAVDRLSGSWFACEGDDGARAVAERIVTALGGKLLPIDRHSKPLYHAAAVFASNYLVALLATAERLAVEAGAPADSARAALVELARGALDGVADFGPADALTGPISRGDADTVRSHLSRLSPSDAALYSVLARATLEVARIRGLDPQGATSIEKLLPENG
ncbi:MAG: DUF2520 domain-containing protein [Gemmatimonadetes bacterium]|nr:DUF2520 domain-containing protein [Gemmatimonadota bacterium]